MKPLRGINIHRWMPSRSFSVFRECSASWSSHDRFRTNIYVHEKTKKRHMFGLELPIKSDILISQSCLKTCSNVVYHCLKRICSDGCRREQNYVLDKRTQPNMTLCENFYPSAAGLWNQDKERNPAWFSCAPLHGRSLREGKRNKSNKRSFHSTCAAAESASPTQAETDDSKAENSQEKMDPSLELLTSSPTLSALRTEKVVPGKGRPPEPPVECCMSGCANCVWIIYAEELKQYYSDGGEAARKAIEQIENPSLKAFVKLEMSL